MGDLYTVNHVNLPGCNSKYVKSLKMLQYLVTLTRNYERIMY